MQISCKTFFFFTNNNYSMLYLYKSDTISICELNYIFLRTLLGNCENNVTLPGRWEGSHLGQIPVDFTPAKRLFYIFATDTHRHTRTENQYVYCSYWRKPGCFARPCDLFVLGLQGDHCLLIKLFGSPPNELIQMKGSRGQGFQGSSDVFKGYMQIKF